MKELLGSDHVVRAEEARVGRDWVGVDGVFERFRGEYDGQALVYRETEEIEDWLRLARIAVVSRMTRAKGSLNPFSVRSNLLVVKSVIEDHYCAPRAVEVARDMGPEYDMDAEVLRDVGKFWQVLAGVSGNAEYLDRAVEAFGRAIEIAENQSAGGVARLELAKLRASDDFMEIYDDVAEGCRDNGDRLATISTWALFWVAFRPGEWDRLPEVWGNLGHGAGLARKSRGQYLREHAGRVGFGRVQRQLGRVLDWSGLELDAQKSGALFGG